MTPIGIGLAGARLGLGLAQGAGAAAAVDVTLTASADISIWFNFPDTNFNTNTSLQLYEGATGGRWHALVKFDLSSLAGKTIQAATLRLITASGYYGGTPSVVAHRVSAANVWIDSQATWNSRSTGVAWAGSAGVNTVTTDYDGTPICSAVAVPNTDKTTVNLVCDANGIADVQAMVDGTNNGFLLRNPTVNAGNYCQFGSLQAAADYRAKLLVTYV